MITKLDSMQKSELVVPEIKRILDLNLPNSKSWKRYLKRYCHYSQSVQDEVNQEKEGCRFKYWCHLVSLIPDQSGVRLTQVVSLNGNAKQAIVRILNNHFKNDNIEWVNKSGEIFIKSSTPLPQTWPDIFSMLNINLYEILNSQGKDWLNWLSLVNECQMLFTQPTPDNLMTEYKSIHGVNGLWVSHIPEWLQMESENHRILYRQGAEFFLQQDYSALNTWLAQILSQVKKAQVNNQSVLVDGCHRWQSGTIRRWLAKLTEKLI